MTAGRGGGGRGTPDNKRHTRNFCASIHRYTSKSCASLTPVYKEESYEEFGFGPREDEDEDDDEYDDDDDDDDRRKDDDDDDYAYESPKQSTRSSPFDIEFDFEGYQKNREYESE